MKGQTEKLPYIQLFFLMFFFSFLNQRIREWLQKKTKTIKNYFCFFFLFFVLIYSSTPAFILFPFKTLVISWERKYLQNITSTDEDNGGSGLRVIEEIPCCSGAVRWWWWRRRQQPTNHVKCLAEQCIHLLGSLFTAYFVTNIQSCSSSTSKGFPFNARKWSFFSK